MVTTTVDDLKAAILSLPQNDYSKLRNWFAERDWELWDKKIRRDSANGKLDFLVDEALNEKEDGKLRLL